MSAPVRPSARSLRILIVEDEVLIRMLFEDMLAELGHTIEGEAGRLDEALELARKTQCDVAVLDVHLSGVEVFPVAELLAERDIPFIFATGYAGAELPEKFRGRPTIQKPFQPDRLQEVLMQVVPG